MNVLVTGGAGYVGSAVVSRLAQAGHPVRILDRLPEDQVSELVKGEGREYIQGDIRDTRRLKTTLSGVQAVVHFAALVLVRKLNEAQRRQIWEMNYEATRTLINVSKELKVERFVFASTCSNYVASGPGDPATEETSLKPSTPYGEAKVAAERVVLEAAGDSFSPTVLRLATVYGPSPRLYFEPLLNALVREALVTGKLVLHGPQAWRPFIHLNDVADAVLRVVDASPDQVSRQIFNVGSNTLNCQKERLAGLIRKRLPNLRITVGQDNRNPRDYFVSFDKISRVLGFRTDRGLEQGIDELVRFLKKSSLTGTLQSTGS